MKQLNHIFPSAVLTRARGAVLAVAALAVIAVAGSALFTPARAVGGHQFEDEDGGPLAQVAQIDQLLADYHGALAYGGNIDAMGSLWVKDSSLTLNGTSYTGKAAVLGFFASTPYFHNSWVSLAPEWKTTVSVHGHTAEATTECIATDPVAGVIKGVIQVNATCEKRGGEWFFVRMNNVTLPEL